MITFIVWKTSAYQSLFFGYKWACVQMASSLARKGSGMSVSPYVRRPSDDVSN